MKTAAGSTGPMSARHGNCLSDKKEKCELSAKAASFVLIHTIFKPLLHCDRCTIPTTRAYREYSTTPSKLNPNSRETTHATSGKNVPIKQKSKFTLAETCPRQQNTLLEEEEKNGLPFVWKQKRQTRRKMSCRKKHAERGKNIHRVFHY